MTKYRKKPVVIEAEQWHPNKPVEGVIYPIPNDRYLGSYPEDYIKCGITETEIGEYMVCPGDWIIINKKGERYYIDNDEFNDTYELVESDQKHVCGPYIDIDVVAHRCIKCGKTLIYEVVDGELRTDNLKNIGVLE